MISKFQYITPNSKEKVDESWFKTLADEGIDWIQFRWKDIDEGEFEKRAEQILNWLHPYSIQYIINDRIELMDKLGLKWNNVLKKSITRDFICAMLARKGTKLVKCNKN